MVSPQPITELIARGQRVAAGGLPVETHRSYPIPVKAAGRLTVAFLYCGSALRRDSGLHLLAPGHLSHIDAVTGELVDFSAITPAELGQLHRPSQEIGVYDMYRAVASAEAFRAARARLYQCYDLLLPHVFGASVLLPMEAEQARAAFPRLFERVAEEALLPYYRRVGEAFFGWLE